MSELNGTLLEPNGTLLELYGILFELNGTLSEHNGTLLEPNGTLLELNRTLQFNAFYLSARIYICVIASYLYQLLFIGGRGGYLAKM